MSLHKLLQRQLNKLGMSQASLPTELKHWQDFLLAINRSYTEADQERYLLERSMEISSHEMQTMNDKLERAQQIARLGYWYHELESGKNHWSKEVYQMFNLDYGVMSPDIQSVIKLAHEKDRQQFEAAITQAISDGTEYNIEMRFKGFSNTHEYKWFNVIGRPIKDDNGKVIVLAGVVMDIDKRKKIEEELVYVHQQLLMSARRAGMADVATSILHNIGNVLNSANVSVELVAEYAKHPYLAKLFAIGRILEEHKADLNRYLFQDPKGNLIPTYLLNLTQKLEVIQQSMVEEIKNIHKHVQHIKDITTMQESIGGVSSVSEKIFVPDIIDTAISMSGDFTKQNIQIQKNYQEQFFVTSDKAKLLQIIVNLLQNAKDALLLGGNNQKQILVQVSKLTVDSFAISVEDNGIGIPAEILTRIFAFGYTTKKNGHGFGLHSSALAAKDLGGRLEAKSAGVNKGAKFILSLPVSNISRREENEPHQQLTDHSH